MTDEPRKCPDCGADIENNDGMFMSIWECTEKCGWSESDGCGCISGDITD